MRYGDSFQASSPGTSLPCLGSSHRCADSWIAEPFGSLGIVRGFEFIGFYAVQSSFFRQLFADRRRPSRIVRLCPSFTRLTCSSRDSLAVAVARSPSCMFLALERIRLWRAPATLFVLATWAGRHVSGKKTLAVVQPQDVGGNIRVQLVQLSITLLQRRRSGRGIAVFCMVLWAPLCASWFFPWSIRQAFRWRRLSP